MNEVISLACFIARLIISDNLSVDQSVLNVIVNSLTSDSGNVKLSVRDQTEMEQALLELLQAQKLLRFEPRRLLEMALHARLYRVAEYLLESLGEYGKIVECYLNDPHRSHEVFDYILRHVDQPQRRISEQFRSNFVRLVECDCAKTTAVTVEHFPELVERLTDVLTGELLFRFLRQLVASEFKLCPRLAETYLELLCLRDLRGVCGFLLTGGCWSDRALEITKKHGVSCFFVILTSIF